MLAVTIALLGGFSALSLQSIRSAAQLVSDSSRDAANDAGILLRVVATQENSTGSYIWIFDYGWQDSQISSVYLNGGELQGWSSNCTPIRSREMCVVHLPFFAQGNVTLFFGGKSLALPS